MFDLFQNVNDVPLVVRKPLKPQATKVVRQRPLVLPRANTTAKKPSRFFERLFGTKKKLKRDKPRTIFGF
jgi:hypothetical protein